MKYVIYSKEGNTRIYLTKTGDWSSDISLARQFSKYDPVRFFIKHEYNKMFNDKVYFGKIESLKANMGIDLSEFLGK